MTHVPHSPWRTPTPETLARRLRDVHERCEPPGPPVRIEPGTMHDFDRLSRLHYRAASPRGVALILRAVAGSGDAGAPDAPPAGVLAVTYPTLNGRWRHFAWGDRYALCGPGACATKRHQAERLNDEVRRIARVIVEPRWRGLGVGSALVRAYLQRPLTIRTEALASIGHACPVFERAGMRTVPNPPPIADDRLRRRLAAMHAEPWMLLDPDRGEALMHALEPALRTWARASGLTRRLAGAPVHRIARAAVAALAARPIAYTHEAPRLPRAVSAPWPATGRHAQEGDRCPVIEAAEMPVAPPAATPAGPSAPMPGQTPGPRCTSGGSRPPTARLCTRGSASTRA